jgi:hypothetical protein
VLTGPGRADQAGVLRSLAPFQRGEVVERRGWDRGGTDLELVEGRDHRERRDPHAGVGVGLVAGGDLDLDEGAQELLGFQRWVLAVSNRSKGEAAHRGHLQPLEPSVRSGARAGGVVVTRLPRRGPRR